MRIVRSPASPATPRAGLAAERMTITAPAAVAPPVGRPVPSGKRRPLGPGRERAAGQPSEDTTAGMMEA
ncbi:hypothetical protein ACFU9X_44115 [Streptomyces atratus]|uniref:hypothetical protein n=1 Tax=Streptomyces atratus TaxID=1893 RepID=UPI00367B725E